MSPVIKTASLFHGSLGPDKWHASVSKLQESSCCDTWMYDNISLDTSANICEALFRHRSSHVGVRPVFAEAKNDQENIWRLDKAISGATLILCSE